MDDFLNDTVETCWSLIKKIIDEIPITHKSCIKVESLPLQDDLSRWEFMASSLGLPSAHTLTLSPNDVSGTLSQILTGLQLHKAVLETVKEPLSSPEDVKLLLADLDELLVQISKVLKHVNTSPPPEPTLPDISSQLKDEYNIQVSTHVTLLQLQRFGQEVFRFFRSLLSNDP
ncbi:colony stimulating factor 3 (granulocyte) a [Alosa pseudoharengus]|uniref:colony stimulating factor 3 (granulocyte) a n=1 Tax=Alosa pseudoharengus TaxID=34774 RepID=UPI003F8CE1AD